MEQEETVYQGVVVWFSNKKNYGFIGWSDGATKKEDMFVHFSDINMQGYKTLQKDQKVSFKVGQNRNGDPKAVEVTIL